MPTTRSIRRSIPRRSAKAIRRSTTRSVADVQFPFFNDPSSILGLLFGQQVTFVNVDLGFGASVSVKPTLAAISFFGILTASLNLDVAPRCGYRPKFRLRFDRTARSHQQQPGRTRRSCWTAFTSAPIRCCPAAATCCKLDAKLGVGLNASAAVRSRERRPGGWTATQLRRRADGFDAAKPAGPLCAVDRRPHQRSLRADRPPVSDGGRLAYLDFVYSSFWGLGPSGTENIADVPIFHYPSVLAAGCRPARPL